MAKNIFNRTVKTNIILYPTDGTGRDCYITYNNAGFWKDNINKITSKEKFGRKPFYTFHSLKRIPPSWNYHADGTGRDGYVLYDCGGLIHRFHSPNSNYLRNYNDDMGRTQYKNSFLSRDEKIYKNKLYKIQNDLLQRLYYKPKRQFKYLHKDYSAPNIFANKNLDPIKRQDEVNNNNEINNNYNYNNYNERYNYDIGTIDKRITTKPELRNSLLEEKNSNEDISYNPKITNNFRNFKKYKVKCLANSIDERAYKYPFNQFTYKKK